MIGRRFKQYINYEPEKRESSIEGINLSEKQKDKLLEMCKSLFPEYHNHRITDHQGRDASKSNAWRIEFIWFSGPMGGLALKNHWFEFCWTHLKDKIFSKIPNYELVESHEIRGLLKSSSQELHPVDYLYEEFKKLKK